MTKILRVGDLHVKPSNLEESEALMGFVLSKASELQIDKLEILGDVFDSHSVVRLEVTEFWDRWFTKLSKQSFKTIVLVGNHDLTGSYSSSYSALHPFLSLENDRFKIVHEPYRDGLYGYLPYIHDNDKFVEEANKLANQGATVLVSHPNYEGAVYDNGVGISGAVRVDLLAPSLLHLIGGHIHTELEIGRVWYVGTPRWFTKSCANKKKGIWICNHDDKTGTILSKEFVSTESVCSPILLFEFREGDNCPEIPEGSRSSVELIGSSEWVSKQKAKFKGLASISSKITDKAKPANRKTGNNLEHFIDKVFEPVHGIKKERMVEYMKELGVL